MSGLSISMSIPSREASGYHIGPFSSQGTWSSVRCAVRRDVLIQVRTYEEVHIIASHPIASHRLAVLRTRFAGCMHACVYACCTVSVLWIYHQNIQNILTLLQPSSRMVRSCKINIVLVSYVQYSPIQSNAIHTSQYFVAEPSIATRATSCPPTLTQSLSGPLPAQTIEAIPSNRPSRVRGVGIIPCANWARHRHRHPLRNMPLFTRSYRKV